MVPLAGAPWPQNLISLSDPTSNGKLKWTISEEGPHTTAERRNNQISLEKRMSIGEFGKDEFTLLAQRGVAYDDTIETSTEMMISWDRMTIRGFKLLIGPLDKIEELSEKSWMGGVLLENWKTMQRYVKQWWKGLSDHLISLASWYCRIAVTRLEEWIKLMSHQEKVDFGMTRQFDKAKVWEFNLKSTLLQICRTWLNLAFMW